MKRILLSVLLCATLLAGCSNAGAASGQSTSTAYTVKNIALSLTQVDNTYSSVNQIYKQSFQDTIHKEIETIKKSKSYTIDDPLFISNPYCTITDGLYVYFKTSEKVQVKYTVETDKYGTYTGTVYENSGSNLTTEHETTLIGIVPGVKNKITITTIDKNGKALHSIKFNYNAPSKLGKYATQATIKKGSSTQKLSNGLYTIFWYTEGTSSTKIYPYIAMYDNKGVLRCEIPVTGYRAVRLLFKNNCMYFGINHTQIVSMEKTGYVNRIYSTGEYDYHHDYILGNNNDILLLGSDPNAKTTEDLVLDLNLKTGNVEKLIDFKTYLKEYYKTTSVSNTSQDKWIQKTVTKTQEDWVHLNSLTLTKDGELLVSCRETSTIVAFKNIYSTSCKIDYMLGSDNFWSGTGYENLLFKASGGFSLHAGQHGIRYDTDDSLKSGQYYLILFNNNITNSTTRSGYNWLNDSNYKNTGTSVSDAAEYSYYYKYLVDENKKTYKLVKSIAIPYSAYVSSVQDLSNGNVFIDSGFKSTGYEYDSQNKLIQSITVGEKQLMYRALKYDFKNFWFK